MRSARIPVLAVLALLSIALVSGLVYALWVEPARVTVVKHNLQTGDAASAVAPWRLVQVSDLHLQAFGVREQALARQVQGLGADVVVLSGDAIDRADALPWLRDFVKALGDVPVLLVPGNWEHWSGVDFAALADSGAKLLLNGRWSLSRGGRTLQVIGLDDFTAGKPDLQLLVNSDLVDTVLVQHSPGFFDLSEVHARMGVSRLRLCLAGHTHGGQIAIAGWAPFRPVGSGRFVAGFYDVPGCRLFVSRGVGTSVLPLRFGAGPEVVVFEL